MISYSVYKVVHLVGVMMVFLALGAVVMHVINGGTKAHSFKRSLAITHGVGLLLSLVGGFGLLARLGIVQGGLPGWVIAKLVIWTLFGAVLGLIYKLKSAAKPIWILTLVLGATAAYLAGSKPF